MKKRLLIMLCIMMGYLSHAQTIDTANYPVVGRCCPDFILRNIRYYSKKQATLNDFKGKWLVLDFWNTHCGACVASFPRVSAMQQVFGDKVQFMMVGIQDKEKQIEPMYAKFRQHEKLVMPCAFDSLLAKRWDIYTCPHVIIIDDKGIIRAITGYYHREDIQGFLSGNPPHLDNPFRYDWEKDTKTPFDPKKLYLLNGNGGRDSVFLFRSILSAFQEDAQQVYFPENIMQDSASGRFQALGTQLLNLYNFAYYGKSWPDSEYQSYPVLEIKDSTLFRDNSYNEFCYTLSVPMAQRSEKRMMQIMQRDLKNYFGYDAKIEVRDFSFWRLVATEIAKRKLKSKERKLKPGGKSYVGQILPHTGLRVRNFPFNEFLGCIRGCRIDGPVIDETGITGNIDISIEWVDADFDSVKKALHENGLDLIRDVKPWKVLVISDPIPNTKITN